MNHVVKMVRTKGFTLIELMLAMTFISVLLVAIALTVIQISNIYNRGLTLKEVNQAGRSVSNELQRSITSTAAFTIETGIGSRYVKNDWGGRLCTGQYSYIWNYGKAVKNNSPSGSSLNVYDTVDRQPLINFVKVIDSGGIYCTEPSRAVARADATELLNVGDHSLAIHKLSIISNATATDTKTRQRLYTINFAIGTNDGTNDQSALNADASTCLAPDVEGSDLAYCSVQEFTIVARAGNTGSQSN